MMRRTAVALTSAVIGWVMYRLMQRLLGADTLPNAGAVGLAVGAIASTLVWYDPRRRGWLGNLSPALAIVGVTIVCIGASVGVGECLHDARFDVPTVLMGMLGMSFFALIYACWWLVPGLTTLLWAINRFVVSRDEVVGGMGDRGEKL